LVGKREGEDEGNRWDENKREHVFMSKTGTSVSVLVMIHFFELLRFFQVSCHDSVAFLGRVAIACVLGLHMWEFFNCGESEV